ncbi:Holliday junction resolvase RuvX [Aeromicrobium sp. NPDC092404]|uniref:Holliday junction resolvase RuvX n=1 Tax=Aeromicrobium sp. NPDC092404 TaxID=3154976 RepID=UPI00342F3F96
MDVGDVRIGVAMSDPDGILATPVETVAAGPGAIARLAELVVEHAAIECVVGLPVGLSGREGPAAVKVRAFCAELQPAIDPVPIRLFDERMSTMTAAGQLRHSGRSGASRRTVIDQAAATVILQTALDTERTRGSAPGETL